MNRNRTHPLRSSPLRLQRNRVDKLVQPPPVDLNFIKSNEYLKTTGAETYLTLYRPSVRLINATAYSSNKAGPGFISSSGFLKMRNAFPAEPRFEYLASPIGRPIRPLGINIDTNQINALENSRTMATGVGTYQWTATNMTGAGTLNAIGPDGTTSAITLKATANLGYIEQPRGAIGSGTKFFSVWLKRKTGIGSIEIKASGVNWSSLGTITSEWVRYSVTTTTSTNVGIRFQNLNDEVYVYAPQLRIATPTGSTTLPNEIIGDAFNITSADDYFTVNINTLDQDTSVITGEVGTVFIEIDMSDRGSVAQYTEGYVNLSDGGDQTWEINIVRDPAVPLNDEVILTLLDGSSGIWYSEALLLGGLNNILRIAVSWDTRTPTGTVSVAAWSNDYPGGVPSLTVSDIKITSLNAFDPGFGLNNSRLFYVRKCKVWNEYKSGQELQMIVTNG